MSVSRVGRRFGSIVRALPIVLFYHKNLPVYNLVENKKGSNQVVRIWLEPLAGEVGVEDDGTAPPFCIAGT
jgi:hypothetical protein